MENLKPLPEPSPQRTTRFNDTMKKNIFGLSPTELADTFSPLNLPPFRAKQVAKWLYQKGATDFAAMTDLSKELRSVLADNFVINAAEVVRELHSADGATSKFLLRLSADAAVETVLMRHDYGNSLCVSTQVGCAMGCRFCASALNGFARNLTAAEILAQVIFAHRLLQAAKQKLDTIVVMGMGEPLMNYDNVLKFMRTLHEAYALNFSYRGITLSTSGIVPNIYRLAKENIPVNLAISLHAPTDELRSEIMPVNRKFPVAEVVAAGKYYGDTTKRRVTYEYILLGGINDSERDADKLAKLLKGQLAGVNLIPFNGVNEREFVAPAAAKCEAFLKTLTDKHGIAATVRREMGADVNAACGQLRRQQIIP